MHHFPIALHPFPKLKTDDSEQVLTLPPNRITANPDQRFRRRCPVPPALRNSPESRARLLMALAPLPRRL